MANIESNMSEKPAPMNMKRLCLSGSGDGGAGGGGLGHGGGGICAEGGDGCRDQKTRFRVSGDTCAPPASRGDVSLLLNVQNKFLGFGRVCAHCARALLLQCPIVASVYCTPHTKLEYLSLDRDGWDSL